MPGHSCPAAETQPAGGRPASIVDESQANREGSFIESPNRSPSVAMLAEGKATSWPAAHGEPPHGLAGTQQADPEVACHVVFQPSIPAKVKAWAVESARCAQPKGETGHNHLAHKNCLKGSHRTSLFSDASAHWLRGARRHHRPGPSRRLSGTHESAAQARMR